ncbi:YggS family pyridoxal phosphate-dependent enzyme [Marinobacterium sp. D7]|uniref:YggS family pyridoxal phosphate-dependent enzyme n=1 Tax=Marinobacterium ramblicola TaxID=2849041 RepID=UPI001C2DC4E9|nr:YggS family pyridoxal phosphate-dependent enzyme [Marinobacterium ramblicola]MBV1788390.1 YggS family pyridoxal phosphate-dependent enzyme [Marinobacterium ramblicola]
MNTSISENIAQVSTQITRACQLAGRASDSVSLLAVSKTRPAEDIRSAYACGLTRFGENYLQEALDKIEQLADLPLEWHFIGPIQSNKTRPIAEHFHWVHSVDRLKIAQRLSEQRPADLPALNICLQVNISREESKSGCLPEQALELAQALSELPNLRLRGLMAIPRATEDEQDQRRAFADLRQLLERLQQALPGLDTLSMGMSGDLIPAIAEGATIVRIGTALFGARVPKNA